VLGRDLNQPGYIFNIFNIPELFKIMFGIFMPGAGYADGFIYFWLWIGHFMLNFFILQIMYQQGRAGVTIPISYNVNFLVSIIFGFVMFEETMTVFSWIGMCVMVVGIFLTSKIESKYVGTQPTSLEPAGNVALSLDTEEAPPA
jgi:multidrug transporter EmrE-like cation transporter